MDAKLNYHLKFKTAMLALLFTPCLGLSGFAQDCSACATRDIPPRGTLVKQWTETEIVSVPVVRTYETREVFATGQRQRRERRLRSVNWSCVAAGLSAFAECNFSKRSARKGDRRGIFGRLFFWRNK